MVKINAIRGEGISEQSNCDNREEIPFRLVEGKDGCKKMSLGVASGKPEENRNGGGRLKKGSVWRLVGAGGKDTPDALKKMEKSESTKYILSKVYVERSNVENSKKVIIQEGGPPTTTHHRRNMTGEEGKPGFQEREIGKDRTTRSQGGWRNRELS